MVRFFLQRKQGSERIRVISLFQTMFSESFKVFPKIADTAEKIIKDFYLNYFCVCVCIFFVCSYVYMCILFV